MTSMMSRGAIAAAVVSFAGTSSAQVLLVIDLTVENQVTIFSTGAAAAASADGSDTTGIYFENFYGGPGDSLSATYESGFLTSFLNAPDAAGPLLFRGGSGADPGLNMFSWTDDFPAQFEQNVQAFSGSTTWSLDANEYADMLAGNTFGDIVFPADTFDDVGTVIGQYEVIPSTGVMPAMVLGLAAAARRRR